MLWAGYLIDIISLIFTTILLGKNCYTHFMDEEINSLRDCLHVVTASMKMTLDLSNSLIDHHSSQMYNLSIQHFLVFSRTNVNT